MAELIDPPSILAAKTHEAPSVFQPENLLREARRQRGLPDAAVPAVCALDPDGDIVRALRAAGRSRRAAGLGLLPHRDGRDRTQPGSRWVSWGWR